MGAGRRPVLAERPAQRTPFRRRVRRDKQFGSSLAITGGHDDRATTTQSNADVGEKKMSREDEQGGNSSSDKVCDDGDDDDDDALLSFVAFSR